MLMNNADRCQYKNDINTKQDRRQWRQEVDSVYVFL